MRHVALLIVLAVFAASVVQAQTTNASVTGQISDTSKAIISDARITLIDMATNVRYEGVSNATGTYYVTDLPVGTYRLEVEKPGFKTVVKPDIVLHVQDVLQVNFEMAVGSTSEIVTVAAGASAIELATSAIDAVVNSNTVRELPLDGRSWTDLAILQPGVSQIETQPAYNNGGGDRGTRGFGQELAIAGARPTQNNYRLDGVSINDYSNGAGSVLGGNLGVDAIEEFSVLTSNYSAEYGKTAGGVVNAVTRSGTNQFHGAAYWFLRDQDFDARNFFDISRPPFHRNQFGVAGGGPIRKDRTFIFADYEGIRQDLGVTQIDFVPSQAARNGMLSTGTVTVDPAAQKALGLFPLPNQGLISPDVGRYNFSLNQSTSENFFTSRVDHKISNKDSLFGTYLFDRTSYGAPDAFDNVLNQNLTARQMLLLEESHLSGSSFLNAAHFGFTRDFVNDYTGVSAINRLGVDPTLSAVPGQSAPTIAIGGGLTKMPGGPGAIGSSIYHWNTFQEYDDASLVKGLHSFKFGAAVERDQDNQLNPTQISGVFTFGSLADFLTNQPTKFQAAIPGLLSERGIRQTILGLYVQDDWRARSNLTLNLGLRYEMATVPTEVEGKEATLINITDTTPHLGNPYFLNPTKRDFQPRVGFSWDPFGDGKTAVRGGFGIFDVLPLTDEFLGFAGQSEPFFNLGAASNLPPGSFPGGALAFLAPTALRVVMVDHQPKRNYVMQRNFNVQRQITQSLITTVAYVGSRGVHQPFRVDDADTVIPTLTSAGYLFPAPVGSGTKINPNFGDIRRLRWAGDSYYDSLQIGVMKRMTHGLQAQGSFTWGKSIDTSSSTVASDGFLTSISSLPSYDLGLERSLSDFNVGRTLMLNFNWRLPDWKSASKSAAWVVNGWELGAIFQAQDGSPFTPTWGTGSDPSGTESSDDYAFPDRIGGPGCQTPTNPGNPYNYIKTECFTVPSAPSLAFWQANCDTTSPIGPNGAPPQFPDCFNLVGNSRRNDVIGPGLVNLNFSVFKNNYIRSVSENFNIQFRMEVFNLLNRANFSPPANPVDIFDGTGTPTGTAGQLIATTTSAREIQFALKVIW